MRNSPVRPLSKLTFVCITATTPGNQHFLVTYGEATSTANLTSVIAGCHMTYALSTWRIAAALQFARLSL